MWLRIPSLLDVAVRIQHHPSRRHLIPALLANLGSLDVEVVADPGGQRPIAWRTYRECLQRPCNALWTVVLQDDALLCPGFPDALTSALSAAGEHPVALFVPQTMLRSRTEYLRNAKAGLAWSRLDWGEWVPVVALAWPTRLVEPFLAWADSRGYDGNRWRADDAIVGEWARHTRTEVLATIPCLVDHPDVEPSLTMPRRGHRAPRSALLFAADGASNVNWNGSP